MGAVAHAHHENEVDQKWGTSGNEDFAEASPGKIAMWFFLVSDALSFSGLLLSYGILRGGSEIWRLPGEPELGIDFTAGLTFLLICSSVTMVLAVQAAHAGHKKDLVKFLGLTVLGGVLFLCGQLQEYWGVFHAIFGYHGLIQEGLIWGDSHRATTFYLITGFHGCHVLTGVLYNSIVLGGAITGRVGKHNSTVVEIAGLFWHFVDLVWILVFTLIYLI